MSHLLEAGSSKLKVRSGFTLIELLVVIAIIGLLSTIAVVALNSARVKGRDAKRIADVRQMQTALALYANDAAGGYPGIPVGTSPSLGKGLTSLTSGGFNVAGTTFMGLIPRDPSETGDAVICDPLAPALCDYGYSLGGAPGRYEILFFLESGAGTLSSSGTYCATEAGITKRSDVGGTCVH